MWHHHREAAAPEQRPDAHLFAVAPLLHGRRQSSRQHCGGADAGARQRSQDGARPNGQDRQAAGHRAQPTVKGVDHLGDQARAKQDFALQDEHRDRQQDEDRQAAIDAVDQELETRAPHEIAEENDVGAEEGENDGKAEQHEYEKTCHQQ